MKKRIALLLVLLLTLPAFLWIFSASASEATPRSSEGRLKITHANMQFASTVYLLIAVDYSEVYSDLASAMSDVTVTVTNKAGEKTVLTPDPAVMKTEGFPANALGFRYTELSAKNIGDILTLEAKNGKGNDSEAITYSLLEYAIKVKATYPADHPLVWVVNSLLEFGAEAQRAFRYSGDYMLYDESGYIDYAMLYVSGADTKKHIVPIGSEFSPTASDAVGANPALYDTKYDRIQGNTLTVTAGISKYFFVGDATRTAVNFDMDLYAGDKIVSRNYYDTATSTAHKITYAYSQKDGTVTKNAPANSILGTDHSILTTNAGSVSASKPDGGYRILEPGAMTFATGENTGYNFDISKNNMPTNLSEDKFTVSISIKAPKDLTSLGGGNATLSYMGGSPRFRNGYVWMFLWATSGGKFYLGAASTGAVLGELSADSFTTFHIVVDRKAGTFTGYDANGNCVGTCSADTNWGFYSGNDTLYEDSYGSDPATFLSSDGLYINWSITNTNRAAVFNLYTITNGNIFE